MLTLEFKPACFIWFGLHRKEVIQPHLPIRLPCYDFTPVANPTFGSVLTRLDYWLRVLPAPMVWRAVCTRPGNVFTAACWSAITSNSDFMQASCSLQSELRQFLGICSTSLYCFPLLYCHCSTCVAQVIRGMMIWRRPHLPPFCQRQSY